MDDVKGTLFFCSHSSFLVACVSPGVTGRQIFKKNFYQFFKDFWKNRAVLKTLSSERTAAHPVTLTYRKVTSYQGSGCGWELKRQVLARPANCACYPYKSVIVVGQLLEKGKKSEKPLNTLCLPPKLWQRSIWYLGTILALNSLQTFPKHCQSNLKL